MKAQKNLLFIFVLLGLFALAPGLASQEIVTGTDFFDRVAENYSNIQDYIAEFEMIINDTLMSGTIYFKDPNLMRIDFTEPEEQVLVSDGSIVKVYVPDYNVTLTQTLKEQTNPGLASEEGLGLLRRNYQIAFKNSPDPEPLVEGDSSSELVYKLFLTWRNTAQGFREIEIAVTPDLFIRQMTAVTADRRDVQFTFKDVRINQNIPDARFDYDSPPSSNNFDNFLYGVE
jgi:outer membrane lipoprotein-sorting protein